MKKILLGLLVLFSFLQTFSQAGNDSTKYTYYKYQYGQRMPRYKADSVLEPPTDTVTSKYGLAIKIGVLYFGNGVKWTAVGASTSTFYDSTLMASVKRLKDSSANKLRGIFRRNDSVFAFIGSTVVFQFKDSVGSGGGGGVNTSVGGGYRVIVVGGNQVKTLTAGAFIKYDTTISGEINVRVDSAALVTWLNTSHPFIIKADTAGGIRINGDTISCPGCNVGGASTAYIDSILAAGDVFSVTNIGTSGPATLVGPVLNIPQYSGGGTTLAIGAPITGSTAKAVLTVNNGKMGGSINGFSFDSTMNTVSIGGTPSNARLGVYTNDMRDSPCDTCGAFLINNANASATYGQVSPAFGFASSGWKTTGGGSVANARAFVEMYAVQGVTSPLGTLRFRYNIDFAGNVIKQVFAHDGRVAINNSVVGDSMLHVTGGAHFTGGMKLDNIPIGTNGTDSSLVYSGGIVKRGAPISGGGSTNLDTTRNGTQVTITPTSGTAAIIKSVDTTNNKAGVMSVVLAKMLYGKPRVFNVTDYGATIDSSSHDDGPAIQAATNAAYAAGGGVVFFPIGHYTVSGALNHSTDGVDPNSQIVLPLTQAGASSYPLIEFVGEARGNWSAEIVAGIQKNKLGVIIESTTLNAGFIFGSSFYTVSGLGGPVNYTWWKFSNIELRTRTITSGTIVANTMSGIDSWAPRSISFSQVKVTNQSSEGDILQPTTGTIGVRLPHYNNNSNINLDGLFVSGYYHGVTSAEHMHGSELAVVSCYNAIYLVSMYHGGSIEQLTLEGNVNNIYVSNDGAGSARPPMDLHINNYNAEHLTTAVWNAHQYDVYYQDTSVPTHVTINNAHVGESFVGRVYSFVTNCPKKAIVMTTQDGPNVLYNFPDYRYPLRAPYSATFDPNTFYLENIGSSVGITPGPGNALGDSSGALVLRGVTYPSQRGNVYLGAGKPSAPGTGEGSINFYANGANKMMLNRVGYLGIGNTNPARILDVASTTSGAVLPRMNTTQMNALTAVTGQMIFNLDSNFYMSQNSANTWDRMVGGGGSGGGGGTPGGSSSQFQYNNSGVFSGSANYTYDGTRPSLATGMILNGTPTSSDDKNIFYGASSATTLGMVMGATSQADGTIGPFIVGRGITYSANSNQRGNLYLGSGIASSPGAAENGIYLITDSLHIGTTSTKDYVLTATGTAGVGRWLPAPGGAFYTSDGTLSSNRTITGGANNLTLTTTNTSPFNVTATAAGEAANVMSNTNSTGAAAWFLTNNRGVANNYGGIWIGGQTTSGSLFGKTLADKVAFFSNQSNNSGLLVGTVSNQVVTIGANNTGMIDVSGTQVKLYNTQVATGTPNILVKGTDSAIYQMPYPSGGSATWGSITGTLSSQSDLNTALGLKAPLASPALTGTPTVPTASAGTNTTQAASTAFVIAQASSASYTPTLTNTTNITSSSLEFGMYTQIGNIVTVRVSGTLSATSAALSKLTISLPVSTATTTQNGAGQGVVETTASLLAQPGPGFVFVDSGTTASFICFPTATGSRQFSVTFMYKTN